MVIVNHVQALVHVAQGPPMFLRTGNPIAPPTAKARPPIFMRALALHPNELLENAVQLQDEPLWSHRCTPPLKYLPPTDIQIHQATPKSEVLPRVPMANTVWTQKSCIAIYNQLLVQQSQTPRNREEMVGQKGLGPKWQLIVIVMKMAEAAATVLVTVGKVDATLVATAEISHHQVVSTTEANFHQKEVVI